jgi:hypothetical protein
MENDRTIHLPFAPLNGKNWIVWSSNFQDFIILKDVDLLELLGEPFEIDEETGKPKFASSTQGLRAAKLLAYLRLACIPSIAQSLIGLTIPSVAWSKLKDTYHSQLKARICQLEDMWSELEMGGGEEVATWVTRVETLRMELAEVGIVKAEMSVISTILKGLPSTYSVLKIVIKNSGAAMTVQGVLAMLAEHESSMKGTAAKAFKASFAKGDGVFKGKCWDCGEVGHRKGDKCCKGAPAGGEVSKKVSVIAKGPKVLTF